MRVQGLGFRVCSGLLGLQDPRLEAPVSTQRAQYPLIKEYGINNIGLHIMI